MDTLKFDLSTRYGKFKMLNATNCNRMRTY